MSAGESGGTAARAMMMLARVTALAGGAVLIALVVLTVVSVTGRSMTGFGLSPVAGDFELVEIGVGFAIFAFLPWCHLTGGHASVDILTARLAAPAQRAIAVIADGLMLAAAALIAWRLWLGMLDKIAYHETTFIREIPVWWAYAAAMLGAVCFTLIAAWCLWLSLTGQERPRA